MPKRIPIGYVPLRGTQTFVGVMSHVWDRPSLTALEIAWRWLPLALMLGVLFIVERIFGIGAHWSARSLAAVHALQSISVFQPVVGVDTVRAAAASLFPHPRAEATDLLIQLLLWNLASALGRTLVLRRLDPALHARRLTLFLLCTFRTLCLTATWALWLWLVLASSRIAITTPAARGEEPSLVFFAAMLIIATLAIYVLWAAISWPLHLAPLLAMRNNTGLLRSLRSAFASPRDLRSKLIETNLVMCIVRLALIILAMVLSASPLAFQTVATQQFFVIWWSTAVLLYLAASDYFHVVRSAAYLNLLRACVSLPGH